MAIIKPTPGQETDCAKCEQCCEPKWKGYIRPFGFYATLFMFFALMIMDGNVGDFTVKAAYLNILEGILLTIIVTLYGSRGIEKTTKTIMAKPQLNLNASVTAEASTTTTVTDPTK